MLAIVKVKKEKEEKNEAKKAPTQQATKQFYCYPMGNKTENKHFCPFTPKECEIKLWRVFLVYLNNLW